MPEETIYLLRMIIDMLRRFRWVLMAIIYLALFVALEYKAILLLVPFFLLAVFAYAADKQREAQGKDDFRSDLLFYRYGVDVDRIVLNVPVQAAWGTDETSRFAQSLQDALSKRIFDRLPRGSVQVDGNLLITDQASGEKKNFLRTLVRSRFGSLLTHFIHYASFGRTITAHYFIYLRGTHSDWDVLKFVLESPLTIWFWGIPWLLNRRSIIADISNFRDSSFDGIDLETMHNLMNQVVYEETTRVLEEAGVLTPETEQILHYHFYGKVKIGGQKINIDDSPGARIEGVSQAVPVLQPSA